MEEQIHTEDANEVHVTVMSQDASVQASGNPAEVQQVTSVQAECPVSQEMTPNVNHSTCVQENIPNQPEQTAEVPSESPFEGYNQSSIGGRHVKQDMPCQDNSGYYCCANYSIAVIADGHSDYHCLRSEIGSKIAVEVAIEVIRNRIDDDGIEQFKQDVQLDEKDYFDSMWKQILNQWRIRVREYHNTTPISDEEFASKVASTLKRYEDQPNMQSKIVEELDEVRESSYIYHIYGTTLRIGAIFNGGYFLMTLGDGASVAVLLDGTAESPIHHEDLGASVTYSICDADAMEHTMHHYSTNDAAAIAVFSDGVEFSGRDDENEFLIKRHVKDIICEILSNPEWRNEIKNYIENRANEDPKDDCSIGLIFRKGLNIDTYRNTVAKLEWVDDPIRCINSRPGFLTNISYGYAINSFDKTCYKYWKGRDLMIDEIEILIKEFPGKFRKIDETDSAELFKSEFKKLLQRWSRRAIDLENSEGDTPEEQMLRLSNGLVYDHDYEKYGISIALWIRYNGIFYSTLIGNGKMEIVYDNYSTTVLKYDEPQSVASIGLNNIMYCIGSKLKSIALTEFSPKLGSVSMM